jgi:hypothetical protein
MQCLRCLCVQCRDPMNPVDTHNGVSVPDGTSRLVTLHNECFVAWLNSQATKNQTFKPTNQPLPPAVGTDLIRFFIRKPRWTLEHCVIFPSSGDIIQRPVLEGHVNRLLNLLRRFHIIRARLI